MASTQGAMIRLTRSQAREVDRRALEQYQIPGIILMENAARGAAEAAMAMLGPARRQSVLILCGGGNNGGDGLAIARHLHNRGHEVHLALCTDPARYSGDALINWKIARAMSLPTFTAAINEDCSALSEVLKDHAPMLILDAIFGTGLAQEPRPPFGAIARIINECRIPILAIDLPSGLDCDTGRPLGACIRATRTVTFVAEKVGFAASGAMDWTGPVSVADIGAPIELIEAVMREVAP